MAKFDDLIADQVKAVVLNHLALAVYDPGVLRRSRAPVKSFEPDFVDVLDEDDGTQLAVVSGPVRLGEATWDWDSYLRIKVSLQSHSSSGDIIKPESLKAAYIIVSDEATGNCKEVIAIANT